MGKYEPLTEFLRMQAGNEVEMTFAQIERVIGSKLPPKAQKHRAWWSNNSSNNVMTKAWLEAGFRSEKVDMDTWLNRLLAALKAEAAHSQAVRQALESIVIGGPPS